MKWLFIDVALGAVIGAALVGIVIPAVPAAYRGPWLAFGVWVGAIVVFSLFSRFIRQPK